MLTIARLLAPMMPHLAEEMHLRLTGSAVLLAEQAWPSADPALVAAQRVTVAVQIMGKLRATIDVEPDAAEARVVAEAAAEPAIARLLDGARVIKRIYVPNRVVNFVVATQ